MASSTMKTNLDLIGNELIFRLVLKMTLFHIGFPMTSFHAETVFKPIMIIMIIKMQTCIIFNDLYVAQLKKPRLDSAESQDGHVASSYCLVAC